MPKLYGVWLMVAHKKFIIKKILSKKLVVFFSLKNINDIFKLIPLITFPNFVIVFFFLFCKFVIVRCGE